MRIGFVVHAIATEEEVDTTTHLAQRAVRRGHEVLYVAVDAFSLGSDDRLAAHAVRLPEAAGRSARAVVDHLAAARPERMPLDGLDVLMLRNDPAEDFPSRPWARLAGINFARFAAEAGVLVLNDPDGLVRHVNKLSLEHYPAEVRPRSLVSRDRDEIFAFAEEHGAAVVKPLAGSGGRNVFILRPEDRPNRKQMIAAILAEGYVLAQEALPEASAGDVRAFLVDGELLEVGGEPAVLHRKPSGDDLRSNISAGGTAEKADAAETARRVARLVGPRLVADGLFLVGLDLVDEKLLEINVFSPGGLNELSRIAGVDFVSAVLDRIEARAAHPPAPPPACPPAPA